jgi:hypothetical protein
MACDEAQEVELSTSSFFFFSFYFDVRISHAEGNALIS